MHLLASRLRETASSDVFFNGLEGRKMHRLHRALVLKKLSDFFRSKRASRQSKQALIGILLENFFNPSKINSSIFLRQDLIIFI